MHSGSFQNRNTTSWFFHPKTTPQTLNSEQAKLNTIWYYPSFPEPRGTRSCIDQSHFLTVTLWASCWPQRKHGWQRWQHRGMWEQKRAGEIPVCFMPGSNTLCGGLDTQRIQSSLGVTKALAEERQEPCVYSIEWMAEVGGGRLREEHRHTN